MDTRRWLAIAKASEAEERNSQNNYRRRTQAAALGPLYPYISICVDECDDFKVWVGAASGLVVGGPICAVVGGVIGYTEGPNIAITIHTATVITLYQVSGSR